MCPDKFSQEARQSPGKFQPGYTQSQDRLRTAIVSLNTGGERFLTESQGPDRVQIGLLQIEKIMTIDKF